jgi:hypothetical protein
VHSLHGTVLSRANAWNSCPLIVINGEHRERYWRQKVIQAAWDCPDPCQHLEFVSIDSYTWQHQERYWRYKVHSLHGTFLSCANTWNSCPLIVINGEHR